MTDRIALSLKPDYTLGRWDWSLAGEGFGTTGSVPARDREDAVLCALAAAYGELTARGPVQVVVSLLPMARLWAHTAEVARLFPGVTLVASGEGDAAIRDAAMRALNPLPAAVVPRGPLTVATDGSAHRGRVGWGWLADDGRHACGTAAVSTLSCSRRAQPVYAELRAISRAIAGLPGHDLVIRTDCRAAISLVAEWVSGKDRLPEGYRATTHEATRRDGLRWMQEQVRTNAPRLDISWVRGHAGDALNEGADSLAKLSRRAEEGTWGYGPDDVPARARAIAKTFTDPRHRTQPAAAA